MGAILFLVFNTLLISATNFVVSALPDLPMHITTRSETNKYYRETTYPIAQRIQRKATVIIPIFVIIVGLFVFELERRLPVLNSKKALFYVSASAMLLTFNVFILYELVCLFSFFMKFHT
jgi:hypothetical protein